MTMTLLSVPLHITPLGYQPGSRGPQWQSRPLCGGERRPGAAGHQGALHPQAVEPHLWRVRLDPGVWEWGATLPSSPVSQGHSLRQLACWWWGNGQRLPRPLEPSPHKTTSEGKEISSAILPPGQGPGAQHLSPCRARADGGCV